MAALALLERTGWLISVFRFLTGRTSCAAAFISEVGRLLPDRVSLMTAVLPRGSSWFDTDVNGLRGPAGKEWRRCTIFLLDLTADLLADAWAWSSQGEMGAECLSGFASAVRSCLWVLGAGTDGLGAV